MSEVTLGTQQLPGVNVPGATTGADKLAVVDASERNLEYLPIESVGGGSPSASAIAAAAAPLAVSDFVRVQGGKLELFQHNPDRYTVEERFLNSHDKGFFNSGDVGISSAVVHDESDNFTARSFSTDGTNKLFWTFGQGTGGVVNNFAEHNAAINTGRWSFEAVVFIPPGRQCRIEIGRSSDFNVTTSAGQRFVYNNTTGGVVNWRRRSGTGSADTGIPVSTTGFHHLEIRPNEGGGGFNDEFYIDGVSAGGQFQAATGGNVGFMIDELTDVPLVDPTLVISLIRMRRDLRGVSACIPSTVELLP